MTIPIFRPYFFLRCKKCNRKTDHVLASTANVKKGVIEETFECPRMRRNESHLRTDIGFTAH